MYSQQESKLIDIMIRNVVCIKKLFSCCLSFRQAFFMELLLKHKHLYSIKLSLRFAYSRKHSKSLYFFPQVPQFFINVLAFKFKLMYSFSTIISKKFDH